MGQAKLRGTREQRAAAAVERDSAAHVARQRAEAERLAAMTPAARKVESAHKHRARMLICMMLGLTYGLAEPKRRHVPPNTRLDDTAAAIDAARAAKEGDQHG